MRRRRRSPAQGALLLEAVIALLLLSLAALGYAGLQLRALRVGAATAWDSAALVLASGMADRLRANAQAVASGQFNAPQAVADGSGCAGGAACSAAQMALADLGQWGGVLARDLPSGRGVVCLDATPDDGTADAPGCDGIGTLLAVKVFWRLRGDERRLVLSVRP